MQKITREEAIEAMEKVLTYISRYNLDEHTVKTPERYITAWEKDWGIGYDTSVDYTAFPFPSEYDLVYDEMVVELDIPVMSHCAHHLAPIKGVAHIAYIPSETIVGLSKLNRCVEKYARRLQVQERLTVDIATELMYILEPKGVAVQIVAEHMCVSSRGVKHHGSKTVTTKLLGVFEEPNVKQEFFDAIKIGANNGS